MADICRLLDFEEVNDLGMYMGVPLLHERVTRDTHGYVIQRIHDKVLGRKAKHLSLARCITLVKSVLSPLQVYTCNR
ncbi:hypothetical protein GQ457_10G000060 [Hibiscus cannabinus]